MTLGLEIVQKATIKMHNIQVILKCQNGLNRTQTWLISVLAVSLAACSATPESFTSLNLPASSTSSQPINSPGSFSAIKIKSVKEIKFKPIDKNQHSGTFDGINESTAASHKVPSSAPIKASGWAVLPAKGKPADMVIITYGNNNSLVTAAPVNIGRQDVVQELKNPAYKNSGWSATFKPSTLPAGKVVLKAWAYDSTSKEATQLFSTKEIVIQE